MKILKNIKPVYGAYAQLWPLKKYQKEIRAARAAGDHEKAIDTMQKAIKIWSEGLVERFHSHVTIKGAENIPKKGPVFFVSNHQGFADIPAIYYTLRERQAGFIAKDDLKKAPLYGQWVLDVGGLFLDRKNPRAAVKTFTEAEEMMKQGYSFVIFPEGTRSKGGPMNEFKKGAFKIPLRVGAPIVPITISGTWKMLERDGYLHGGECTVVIHPPIETAGMDRKQQAEVPEMAYNIVRDELNKYEPQDELLAKVGKNEA